MNNRTLYMTIEVAAPAGTNDKRPYLEVNLGGKWIQALVDTGAGISILSRGAVERMGLAAAVVTPVNRIALSGVGSEAGTRVMGSLSLTPAVCGVQAMAADRDHRRSVVAHLPTTTFSVVDAALTGADAILGWPTLQQWGGVHLFSGRPDDSGPPRRGFLCALLGRRDRGSREP